MDRQHSTETQPSSNAEFLSGLGVNLDMPLAERQAIYREALEESEKTGVGFNHSGLVEADSELAYSLGYGSISEHNTDEGTSFTAETPEGQTFEITQEAAHKLHNEHVFSYENVMNSLKNNNIKIENVVINPDENLMVIMFDNGDTMDAPSDKRLQKNVTDAKRDYALQQGEGSAYSVLNPDGTMTDYEVVEGGYNPTFRVATRAEKERFGKSTSSEATDAPKEEYIPSERRKAMDKVFASVNDGSIVNFEEGESVRSKLNSITDAELQDIKTKSGLNEKEWLQLGLAGYLSIMRDKQFDDRPVYGPKQEEGGQLVTKPNPEEGKPLSPDEMAEFEYKKMVENVQERVKNGDFQGLYETYPDLWLKTYRKHDKAGRELVYLIDDESGRMYRISEENHKLYQQYFFDYLDRKKAEREAAQASKSMTDDIENPFRERLNRYKTKIKSFVNKLRPEQFRDKSQEKAKEITESAKILKNRAVGATVLAVIDAATAVVNSAESAKDRANQIKQERINRLADFLIQFADEEKDN